MASKANPSGKPPPYSAASPASRPADIFFDNDAIPVPEVIEKDSDSVWAMWTEATQQSSDSHADTQPATLLMGLPELPKDSET